MAEPEDNGPMNPTNPNPLTSYLEACEPCQDGEHEHCERPARTTDATFATGGQHLVSECCCPIPEVDGDQ